jgi:hypothetical protein
VSKNIKYGGSGITRALWDYIVDNITPGATVVELGAGDVSTPLLAEHFNLWSVEQDHNWIGNVSGVNFIHAPIDSSTKWYSVSALSALPKDYELLLIDGPLGEGNREGILNNLELFNLTGTIIIDDTWRGSEERIAMALDKILSNHTLINKGDFCVLEVSIC